MLDAGCGSGILAMSAAKLGAGKVLAFDNDPIAVSAATANVNKTGLDDKITVLLGESPTISPDKSDLVIANIIPNVIINMASELADRTAPGGILIVSGIVEDRVEDVRAALESIGMIFVEDRRQTVWCALVFRQIC